MSGYSLFETDKASRKRQARSLLNDYSHPWDVLAEALQNSLDAINKRYRLQIAQQLGISLAVLKTAIEQAAKDAVEKDCEVSSKEYKKWSTKKYAQNLIQEWFEILAEKLGQGVDAVSSAYDSVGRMYAGEISIERMMNSRKIVVKDNGIGMSFDNLRGSLKRGVTFKGSSSEIGELGNGLTYMVSACDNFEMRTCDGNEESTVQIMGMHEWIQDADGAKGFPEPMSNPDRIGPSSDSFTEVSMESIRRIESDFPDVFDSTMNTSRLIHLLRTKTAVGQIYDLVCYPVFDGFRSNGIEVSLTDDFGGVRSTTQIPFSFGGPADVLEKTSAPTQRPLALLPLKRAKSRIERKQDIGGHALQGRGIYISRSGRTLYHTSFATNRQWYREASLAAGLCDNPGGTMKSLGTYDVTSGIELAVKGMPTAVRVSPPMTGFQGYWGNFHIIILDNMLKFDEGRKTPVGRRTRLYQDCAEEVLFGDITTGVLKRAIKDAVIPLNLTQMSHERESFIKGRLSGRSPLGRTDVKIRNIPRYEQDVVAIFHELIGCGILPFYHSLDCSSKSTYDAIFEYTIPKSKTGKIVQQVEGSRGSLKEIVIIEYKLNGEDLIEDIASDAKFYYMMDLLVCWDIDSGACRRLSADLQVKPLTHVRYWGTTHELHLSSSVFLSVGSGRALDVISIKKLLHLIDDAKYDV